MNTGGLLILCVMFVLSNGAPSDEEIDYYGDTLNMASRSGRNESPNHIGRPTPPTNNKPNESEKNYDPPKHIGNKMQRAFEFSGLPKDSLGAARRIYNMMRRSDDGTVYAMQAGGHAIRDLASAISNQYLDKWLVMPLNI